MTLDELTALVQTGKVAVLSQPAWEALTAQLSLASSHDTGFSGTLSLWRHAGRWLAVECPKPEERTVRLLADEIAAEQFVAERMKSYERLWDG